MKSEKRKIKYGRQKRRKKIKILKRIFKMEAKWKRGRIN